MISPEIRGGVERFPVGHFGGDARLHETRAVEQPGGEGAVDKSILMVASVAPFRHDAMGLQQRQVLRGASRRNSEALRERRHVKAPVPKLFDDPYAVGVRHRLQKVREFSGKDGALGHKSSNYRFCEYAYMQQCAIMKRFCGDDKRSSINFLSFRKRNEPQRPDAFG
jgi:hypothetical protein